MTQIQYLTEQQIEGLMEIIRRDYINPMVKLGYEAVRNTEEYLNLVKELENSDEYKKQISDEEIKYDNNLKINTLVQQIKEIDNDIFKTDDDYYYISSELTMDIKDIGENHLQYLKLIKNNLETEVENKLNLRRYNWDIQRDIHKDIQYRLQLIACGNFDEIIESMIQYINVEKYLYNS